jgi:ankyrin repeat protein
MLALGTHKRPPAMIDALIAAGGRIEHDMTVPPTKGRGDARALPLDIAPVMVDADNPILGGDYQGTHTGMRVGPLAWATMVGRSDVAMRLLERDRRLDDADRNLAYFAAAAGDWNLVLAAARHKADVNAENRAGVTPLMLAADAGRVDVVRALIALGADVRARSARSWPPLLERRFGDEIGAAIAGHSPPKPRLVGGYTAMRAAKERGHEAVVRALREAGAD